MEGSDIQTVMDAAKHMVEVLEALRNEPMLPFHRCRGATQGVVRRLTSTEYALPVTSNHGFINAEGPSEQGPIGDSHQRLGESGCTHGWTGD